ncbi:hypothetical protein JCM11491_003451 [Sporobolomyces phaffii]
MGDRRRTIQSNPPPLGVPSSIPRPQNALRQSLAAGGRPSLLPSHSQSQSRARQSIAPTSAASSYHDSAPPLAQSSSQGSQPFSQGHGGPPLASSSSSFRDPPMTVNRTSMYSSFATQAGSMSVSRNPATMRQSYAPPGGGGQSTATFEYVPPSERRVSTYHRRSTLGGAPPTLLPSGAGGGGGGGPSGGLGSSGQVPMTPGGGISSSTLARPSKDPREVRPRRAQERHAEDILQFLATHQCPFQLSLANLLGPTSTQFSQVFAFLTHLFDPSIRFGQAAPAKGQPKVKFEDEVLNTLRTVQYPFTDSITKSHLQSIGSMQSWPNMLAMLHWLVMVIETREMAFNSDPELQMPAPDFALRSLSTDEVIPHAWFHFLQAAYDKFIAGEEDDMWQGDLEDLRAYQGESGLPPPPRTSPARD